MSLQDLHIEKLLAVAQTGDVDELSALIKEVTVSRNPATLGAYENPSTTVAKAWGRTDGNEGSDTFLSACCAIIEKIRTQREDGQSPSVPDIELLHAAVKVPLELTDSVLPPEAGTKLAKKASFLLDALEGFLAWTSGYEDHRQLWTDCVFLRLRFLPEEGLPLAEAAWRQALETSDWPLAEIAVGMLGRAANEHHAAFANVERLGELWRASRLRDDGFNPGPYILSLADSIREVDGNDDRIAQWRSEAAPAIERLQQRYGDVDWDEFRSTLEVLGNVANHSKPISIAGHARSLATKVDPTEAIRFLSPSAREAATTEASLGFNLALPT